MNKQTDMHRKRVKANDKFDTDDYEYVGGTARKRKSSSQPTKLTIEVSIKISLN